VHGGTYAEELIASIVRARVIQEFPNHVQIHQNRWDKTAKREADICLLRKDRLAVVIEVKSALTKEEWKRVAQIKEDYNRLDNPPNYWLLAIRADALDATLEKAVDEDARCCVLSKQGRKMFELPEHDLRVWKPLEPWLDKLMSSLKSEKTETHRT
jgi:hypothetical protein